MEEKLYFAPANYGKGAKRAEKSAGALATSKTSKEKKNHKVLKLGGFLLILAIAVIVIIWLLRGKTTTSGQYPENVKNESLSCVSNDIRYEIVNKIDSEKKELKINAIFNSNKTLKTISLIYTLNYTNEDEAYGAEAISHAQFNGALASFNYGTSKFSNKFARYDNKLIISLTANKSEFDELSAHFFALDVNSIDVIPNSIGDFQLQYENIGFKCETSANE